ncbi:cellulase family glycosylhydrolase, partial [bacterium]|nr:cellulase family glycosylhydrolase [bacterium]
ISNVSFPGSAALYDVVEITFDSSNDPYSNPFDPAVVDATVTVNPPSGPAVNLVAFWYQDYSASGGDAGWEVYTASGSPKWMARFAATETGTHTFSISVEDSEGTGTASEPSYEFDVVTSTDPGFLERHPTNNKYLAFSDGEAYLPIGHNVSFREGAPTSTKDGTVLWEEYYQRMEDNGENWSRFWMTDFDRTALEWETGHWGSAPDNFDYQGVGKYSLKAAWRVDKKLEAGQQHGIYVQLVLHDHGQFSTHVNARWNGSFSPNGAYRNPYNSAAGGPVADPNDFFGDSTCKDFVKRRLRYIIARYGAYRSILAWELWNEVQFTGNSFNDSFRTAYDDAALQSAVESWHAEMALYLKSNDPYQHLVTTSGEDDWKALHSNWTNLNNVWNDTNIDLIQLHHYRNTAWSGGLEVYDRDQAVADMIASLRSTYDKPVWCGEFGIGDQSKAGGGYEHPDACWTLDGYDPVNSSSLFDPTLAADHRDDHLDQGTHLHNLLWMALVNESLSAYWWWGRYIHEDSSKNRTAATGFPLYYHYKVARAFLDAANANSWPELSLSTVQATASPELRVFGSQASEHAYLFVRDVDNGFGTGSEPGDIGGRTLTGMTITLSGMSPGTEVDVMYCDTWDEETPLGVIASEQVIASPDGFLTLQLPPFQRDVAVIVAPAPG